MPSPLRRRRPSITKTAMRSLTNRIFRGLNPDLATPFGRALVEERYWSLRRQVPIVFLLGFVNVCAMELAATGKLSFGPNLPTFIAGCSCIRVWHWFGSGTGRNASHEQMIRRMRQTVWVAGAVCLAVCVRSLYLLQVGDEKLQVAVMLFGGLTAIGVAYGLTALPAAGLIPLVLIIVPISAAALVSDQPLFTGAAFALVVVAALTMRLLSAHSRHFSDVVRSRTAIVTEQQRTEHARQEAVVAATTDCLTGLPNRRAFIAALDMAASSAHAGFALVILDLDRFKAVNDTFGHALGDRLLEEFATRLVDAAGVSALVARLGGDEFGVLLPDISSATDAEMTALRILENVNGRAEIEGREFTISASCGVALSGERHGRSPSRLMADADLALYQAKDQPGGGAAVFEQRMEAPRRRRAEIERALQLPGVPDQLRVVFQPIFDLKTGTVLAHEALARWSDPELGSVPPSEFVPIAEQLGLIDEINRRLMKLAFDAARTWPKDTKLSFNLSAVQLCSAGLADAVLETLKETALAPARLQVEVTETAVLADFPRARANLKRLKEAGATIVLDDFGAGYASIGYLRELHFDQIKLDGGLVTAAQHSADGKQLLRAVVALCDILGVSTVAEHVESKELLAIVMDLGCTAAQGFWLERPLSNEELAKLSPLKLVSLRRAA